jgi:hypothetical protein
MPCNGRSSAASEPSYLSALSAPPWALARRSSGALGRPTSRRDGISSSVEILSVASRRLLFLRNTSGSAQHTKAFIQSNIRHGVRITPRLAQIVRLGGESLVATTSGDRGRRSTTPLMKRTLWLSSRSSALDRKQHASFPYNDPGQLPVTPVHEPDGGWSGRGRSRPGRWQRGRRYTRCWIRRWSRVLYP